MNVKYNKEQIIQIIDQVVKKTMSMDLTWDWPCGVAYYGVSRAYQVTGERSYIDLLKRWADEYIELGLPVFNINTCAMGHMLITLYEETGDSRYWDIVMSKVEYLQREALRFGDRVLVHLGFTEQAWADTLFMAAFFLLRVGNKLKDQELIKDALHQYCWHIRYLQDPNAKLWYHGYDNIHGDHMSGFFWGRANSWAAYTMSQVKELLGETSAYPEYTEIENALCNQLAALKEVQTEQGLWRTILNDTDSYEETSASCGIAAAMVNQGDTQYSSCVQKALGGILQNISEDGRVLNVSGGTAVMKDKEGYCTISKDWIQGWGQGLALAFLADLISK